MAHIDKKNNQESKNGGKKTKKELYEMKLETANEIGFPKRLIKNKNKYS